LKLIHLVADVITNLNGFFLGYLELLPRSVFKDGLAGFASAFNFLAPLFMLLYLGEKHEILTGVAHYFDYL
jgi:hypothetical protein